MEDEPEVVGKEALAKPSAQAWLDRRAASSETVEATSYWSRFGLTA
jgi:hypothetical protein